MPSLQTSLEGTASSSLSGLTFLKVRPAPVLLEAHLCLLLLYPQILSLELFQKCHTVKVVTCKPNAVHRYITEMQAKAAANTNTENFQHSGLLAFPKGNRTWPSWLCCARCQYVGAQSLFCLFIPEEPPPYFLMAFQLPLTWIQERLDLVASTLEQVSTEVTEKQSNVKT